MKDIHAVSLTQAELLRLAQTVDAFTQDTPTMEVTENPDVTMDPAMSIEEVVTTPEETKKSESIDNTISQVSGFEKSSATAENIEVGTSMQVGPLIGEVNSISELRARLNSLIPDKMAFKIGEVSEVTGIKPYVLRYWESEFETLSPQKSAYNQRMYSRKDVENVLLIKKLLYEEKFSIAGAKKKLKDLKKELRADKQVSEVVGRFDKAYDRFEDLMGDIARIKALFN